MWNSKSVHIELAPNNLTKLAIVTTNYAVEDISSVVTDEFREKGSSNTGITLRTPQKITPKTFVCFLFMSKKSTSFFKFSCPSP